MKLFLKTYVRLGAKCHEKIISQCGLLYVLEVLILDKIKRKPTHMALSIGSRVMFKFAMESANCQVSYVCGSVGGSI